jgi:hypothetical protein
MFYGRGTPLPPTIFRRSPRSQAPAWERTWEGSSASQAGVSAGLSTFSSAALEETQAALGREMTDFREFSATSRTPRKTDLPASEPASACGLTRNAKLIFNPTPAQLSPWRERAGSSVGLCPRPPRKTDPPKVPSCPSSPDAPHLHDSWGSFRDWKRPNRRAPSWAS